MADDAVELWVAALEATEKVNMESALKIARFRIAAEVL